MRRMRFKHQKWVEIDDFDDVRAIEIGQTTRYDATENTSEQFS